MGLTADQQRWCDEIVERALAMDPGSRESFVTEACAGDQQLQQEAVALLSVGPGMTSVFDAFPSACLMPASFGRYQTEELIGSGGMSVVYRALDPVINRRVAIKVMAQRLETSPEEYQRFLTELHLLGSLGHPNIVQVFDAGEHQGLPFIVMEYLEGENLGQTIENRRCTSFAERLAVAQQTADALQRVHEAKVCHRDVKPGNIFLERHGRVKLMDFGISARLNGPRLTQTGALIGTLPYLAPEQLRGEKAGPSVDIYAFGVVLFELFTGSKPFSGAAAELLYKIAHEPLPLAPLAGLPPSIVSLIRNCTAKEGAGRPQGFKQIREMLDRIVRDSAAPAPVPRGGWRVAVTVAAFAITPIVGWFWTSGARRSGPALSSNTPVAQQSGPAPSVAPTTPPPSSPNVDAAPPKTKLDEAKAARPSATERKPGAPSEVPPPAPRSPVASGTATGARQSFREPIPMVSRPKQQIQVAAIPVVPPSTDVVRLPDSIARINELPLRLEPPAPAAPSPAAQQKALDNLKIRDVLARLTAGYRDKSVGEIRRVYPNLPDPKTLQSALGITKTMTYRLEPLSDPEIDGNEARIQCKRTIIQVPIDRSLLQSQIEGLPHASEPEDVLVRLSRIDGAWKITSIR